MPNNKKYRVQDIAADIGADRSAVIELLEGAFEGTKKAQTSLTDQEVSYVIEGFSKNISRLPLTRKPRSPRQRRRSLLQERSLPQRRKKLPQRSLRLKQRQRQSLK